MARMARIVAPGYPHHVTQRGNRRQLTFFNNGDYQFYFNLLLEARDKSEVDIWAYCFMPNHVHLVVVPEHKDSLHLFFAEAHRRYTRFINRRNQWQGHLWQERFHSFVMDESHLQVAVRYVELNPVRAGLCERAEDWIWSSAQAHLGTSKDELVSIEPMLARFSNWQSYLEENEGEVDNILEELRTHTRTGRPSDNKILIDKLETLTGRSLQKQKPGRKPI